MANTIAVGAGGDIIGPLALPAHNTTIVMQLKANSVTGLNVELRGRVSTAAAFKRLKLTDPNTKTDVDSLTTDGQIGWCENIGYSDIQAVQVGATGGSGTADVLLNVGDDE